MATTSKYYKKRLTDAIAATSGGLSCCLLLNTFTIGAGHDTYSDVSTWEVVGVGYTAGGNALSSLASSQVGNNAKFTAANTVFSGVTITPRYAVVYETTSGDIISEHDLGGDKPCVGGTLTLSWNASGILSIE